MVLHLPFGRTWLMLGHWWYMVLRGTVVVFEASSNISLWMTSWRPPVWHIYSENEITTSYTDHSFITVAEFWELGVGGQGVPYVPLLSRIVSCKISSWDLAVALPAHSAHPPSAPQIAHLSLIHTDQTEPFPSLDYDFQITPHILTHRICLRPCLWTISQALKGQPKTALPAHICLSPW